MTAVTNFTNDYQTYTGNKPKEKVENKPNQPVKGDALTDFVKNMNKNKPKHT